MNLQKEEKNKFAVITAIYKDKKYTSIPLELVQDSDNMKLVMVLSESGTELTNIIKFPVSDKKFVVISKSQLYETLFEVEIMDAPTSAVKKEKIIKQVNS